MAELTGSVVRVPSTCRSDLIDVIEQEDTMSRRTINQPIGLEGTYFRLRMDRLTPDGWHSLGYHNQPFATRDAAESSAQELRRRIRRNDPRGSYSVTIVTVNANL